MRIFIYTSITHGYDKAPPYCCFAAENQLDARKNKIMTPCYDEFDYSIWLDGNLRPAVHPHKYIELLGDCDLLTFKHPSRDCCYQEEDMLSRLGYGTFNLDHYKDKLGVGKGLAETSLLVRRHTEQVREFNSIWWDELLRVGVRDQLTFPYAWHSSKIKVALIEGSRNDSPLVHFSPHMMNRVEVAWGVE